jgi:diacylglycerol kinase
MINRISRHTISIKHAWNGVIWALNTQPNYQIHLLLSITAILAGLFLEISYEEFLVIIVMIIIGFTIETVNTAIELAADAITLKWREDIKFTKDVAAGAMLIFAIGAVIISGIIFIPKIYSLVNFYIL